jgi:tetratricopeptide (TPR) repeat protein
MDYPQAYLLALDSLIVNSYFQNRSEQFHYTKLMLADATRHQDKWLMAFALFAVSMAELIKEDFHEARRQAEIHLKLCEEIGDKIHTTVSLIVLGHAALAQDDYESAWRSYLRCLELSLETGFYYSHQTATKYLGITAISMGRSDEAEKFLLQCLVMTREIGFVRDVVNLYYEFARLAAARQQPERAVELLACVIQHPASLQVRMLEGRIRDSALQLLDSLQRELPPEIFQACLVRGQDFELDQVYEQLAN